MSDSQKNNVPLLSAKEQFLVEAAAEFLRLRKYTGKDAIVALELFVKEIDSGTMTIRQGRRILNDNIMKTGFIVKAVTDYHEAFDVQLRERENEDIKAIKRSTAVKWALGISAASLFLSNPVGKAEDAVGGWIRSQFVEAKKQIKPSPKKTDTKKTDMMKNKQEQSIARQPIIEKALQPDVKVNPVTPKQHFHKRRRHHLRRCRL